MADIVTIRANIEKGSAIIARQVEAHFQKTGPFHPHALIICGSGLGGLTSKLLSSPHLIIPYSAIPGFKTSTVQGHRGELWFGYLNKTTPVVVMSGRLHFYEGHEMKDTVFPIRVLHHYSTKYCGSSLQSLVVTNASGGLNPEFEEGDLMVLNDHINLPGLTGLNPLIGANFEEHGPRFLATSDAYDAQLRKLLFEKKNQLKSLHDRRIHEGCYCFVTGPTFESRAESRFIQSIGGDCVGMSTVPEVIVARHCGWKVLAISVITNKCVLDKPSKVSDNVQVPLEQGKANHEEVLLTGKLASKDMETLIEAVASEL
ncbi:hypothetical protein ACO0RG_004321 [Hanseniaspora osmophila]|uniref:Purine nucleoside phosphorylase n=1 Tax=Hanseniaspora osmophila TaxID=56408 RepID=A0A1E5RBB5_9ASCO|nr:Purine nucleoside phosphorylase [Hanseniaspora osmophila]